MQKLTEGSRDTDAAILEMRAKIEHTRQKTYQSKYTQAKTELQAQIKALSSQYKALGDRIKALRAGTQCPTCLMRVTAQNLPDVRSGMMAELQSIAAKGQELMDPNKGLDELDGKSEPPAPAPPKSADRLSRLKNSSGMEPSAKPNGRIYRHYRRK